MKDFIFKNGKWIFTGVLIIVLLMILFTRAQDKTSVNQEQTGTVAPKVDITLNTDTDVLTAGDSKTVTYEIYPVEAGHKFSGIDVSLVAEGNIHIVDIEAPVSSSGIEFNKVFHEVSSTSARLAYVVIKNDNELPNNASIAVTVKGIGKGTGSLKINPQATQIVGNIEENVFGFREIDETQLFEVQ